MIGVVDIPAVGPKADVASLDAGDRHGPAVVGFDPRLIGADAKAGGVVEVVVIDVGERFEFRIVGNLSDDILVDDGLFVEVPELLLP